MTTIGFIGSGHIGSQVARKAVANGYDVVLSNSRGPATLADLVAELGEHARAATRDEAAAAGDVVVISIPFGSIAEVPVEPLAGKIVLDTNNYYWERDGHVADLDDGVGTVTGHLQAHLPGSRVAKAFNAIQAAQITADARPAGAPDRRALVTASDHADAAEFVTKLYDQFGFDTVNVGPLSESWRVDRDRPAYGMVGDVAAISDALARGATLHLDGHTGVVAATFFVVPQWQGSGSSRAMRLVDGADAIRGDLPASATVLVDVPLGAGSDEGTGVQRLSSIIAVRDALHVALAERRGLPVVIGGDCGVELAAIERAVAERSTAVVWLDAHPDISAPEDSPSGAFHGMVVRTLLGEGPAAIVPSTPLETSKLVLAGTRALDDSESSYVAETGIRLIAPSELDADSIGAALIATGASSLYLHVDLDVLDPSIVDGIGYPEPFGLQLQQLLDVIAAAKATLPLVGAGVTEFAPSSPESAADDLGSILRIVGALTS